ncbi:MAG: DEAD/DEAH box helicase [Siphonobacter sp.]
MKFDDYSIAPEIKKNLVSLGFKRPTDIQYKSIPPILKGEDVLAIAQTGTGKTAAFAIPVISLIHQRKASKKSEGIKCIVMVPTRELALQITEVFEKLSQNTRVKTYSLYGGVEQGPQIARLEQGIDILITTPGRMFDLVSQGYIHLNKVEVLILDEADHMLDLGFIKDIQDVIRFLPRKRQTLFFSATINETIKKLAYSLVHKAIRVQISPKDPVSKNIDHAVAYVEMDDKRFFLERLINENPQRKLLVFVRTKVRAERVSKALERMNITSETLHGGKEQSDRLQVLGQFRTGENKVLIATDVSARGIDIPNVDYVVNYDLPEQAENYVHRVGRTGRGVQRGHAVSFCSTEEKPILKEIEKYLQQPINLLEISKADYEATIDLGSESEQNTDWRSLIREEEERRAGMKKRKKK